MIQAGVDQVRRMLLTRDDLARDGWQRERIGRAVAVGEVHRIRRGWYLRDEERGKLWPDARHLARVVAVREDAAGSGPVFSGVSAAAVLGLQLYRVRTDRVHTVHPGEQRRSAPDVVRHRAIVDDADVVEVAGILCTSPERTVYDLARLASPEVAIACADSALARIGGDPRSYDHAAADRWLDRMRERFAAPRARGIRQARQILEIVDGRSQLALESMTKLQLHRLGFRRLGLQVRVPAPVTGSYWMDIHLEDASVFYECDGEGKYRDEALRAGLSLEEVLLAEKRREDWVRGTTGMRVLRGCSADAATPEALAARLWSFGIVPPPRRQGLLLPRVPLLRGQ